MRKLSLNPDDLMVESFEPVPFPHDAPGTVRALQDSAGTGCDATQCADDTCECPLETRTSACEILSCGGPYVTCRVPCTETYGGPCCEG